MELLSRLSAFYSKAHADCRLSPVHLSLYFALLHGAANTVDEPLHLKRDLIMCKAKISSRVTYHKVIRELHQYGYIDYATGNMPGGSSVKMIDLL